MSDLLAKCDWHGDELRVELPQWPEVVTVWVNGKAMAYAPVTDEHKRIYDRCINRVGQLEAENEKLREELAKARDPQRIGGQADPSSFVYAIEQLREFRWQHATNDEDAIPYINNVAAAHERENAKLRELVRHMRRCMSNEYTEIGLDFIATYCEYCEYDNDCGQCDFEQRMAELGIEVES